MKHDWNQSLQTEEEEIASGKYEIVTEWGAHLAIGGAPAKSILDGLDDDDRPGAITENYRRGNYCIHINRCKKGPAFEKTPLPKNRFLRWWMIWLIERDLSPFNWNLQVNYGGACMATSESTRGRAVETCKRWIAEQIEKRSKRAVT